MAEERSEILSYMYAGHRVKYPCSSHILIRLEFIERFSKKTVEYEYVKDNEGRTQLDYQQGVNDTCFGLLGGHHQVYRLKHDELSTSDTYIIQY